MLRADRAIATRFWSKVEKSDPDSCWRWRAGVGSRGYGIFHIGREGSEAAHRVAYALSTGPVPTGAFVCHSCDNPLCCNPGHLWLGSPKDNAADMAAKGRAASPAGELNPAHKLTRKQVVEIRKRHWSGESQRSIARAFGVHQTNISQICRLMTWPRLFADQEDGG
jgi:hypothetical protein